MAEQGGRVEQVWDEAHQWNEIINSVAGKDHLTGLPNRRALVRAFGRESERAVRYQRPLAAIFLDIDKFKTYNDKFSHIKGDKVLISLAQVLREQTRNVDVPCRYGGEEYMILLPETDLDRALEVAERIRLATAEGLSEGQSAGNGNGKILMDVTISAGAAQWKEGQNFDDFAKKADEAMYYAKNKGRNRVAGFDGTKFVKYGKGWLKQKVGN